MKQIHITHNVEYLPLPNRVEFIATRKMAPIDLTKTSFVIPFINKNQVIMAHNQRRGLEIPGGHVEPGETLIQAARRECLEETGYHADDIVPIGYLKMTSEGEVPDDWKYPHPVSYQQFFASETDHFDEYVENDECKKPEVIAFDSLSSLTDQEIMLIREAHNVIYSSGE